MEVATARRKTLAAGDRAPMFADLADRLKSGPALVVFYKASCPTCQFTLPYLERLSRGGVRFLGVSQDDAATRDAFNRRFGVGFDAVSDGAGYPASNAYGITHVPSMFLVEPDGAVSHAWTGFSRQDMEQLGARVAIPAFTAKDNVPAWKAG
jgi:peroxiredoxin